MKIDIQSGKEVHEATVFNEPRWTGADVEALALFNCAMSPEDVQAFIKWSKDLQRIGREDERQRIVEWLTDVYRTGVPSLDLGELIEFIEDGEHWK